MWRFKIIFILLTTSYGLVDAQSSSNQGLVDQLSIFITYLRAFAQVNFYSAFQNFDPINNNYLSALKTVDGIYDAQKAAYELVGLLTPLLLTQISNNQSFTNEDIFNRIAVLALTTADIIVNRLEADNTRTRVWNDVSSKLIWLYTLLLDMQENTNGVIGRSNLKNNKSKQRKRNFIIKSLI